MCDEDERSNVLVLFLGHMYLDLMCFMNVRCLVDEVCCYQNHWYLDLDGFD